MAIDVAIGQAAEQLPKAKAPEKPIAKASIKIRKMLDGNFLITQHRSIDIVLDKTKRKVYTMPKDKLDDSVYDSGNRLMKYLLVRGIIRPDSIVGGSIYGSLEAKILESDSFNSLNLTLLNISKWLTEEQEYFSLDEKYEDMLEDMLLHPDTDDSTELGEIPQKEMQGTMGRGYTQPYFQTYTME